MDRILRTLALHVHVLTCDFDTAMYSCAVCRGMNGRLSMIEEYSGQARSIMWLITLT